MAAVIDFVDVYKSTYWVMILDEVTTKYIPVYHKLLAPYRIKILLSDQHFILSSVSRGRNKSVISAWIKHITSICLRFAAPCGPTWNYFSTWLFKSGEKNWEASESSSNLIFERKKCTDKLILKREWHLGSTLPRGSFVTMICQWLSFSPGCW